MNEAINQTLKETICEKYFHFRRTRLKRGCPTLTALGSACFMGFCVPGSVLLIKFLWYSRQEQAGLNVHRRMAVRNCLAKHLRSVPCCNATIIAMLYFHHLL